MGHGADLGTELAAERKLIDLVAEEYEAQSDPERRRELIKQLTEVTARHVLQTTALMCDALHEYAAERNDDLAQALVAQARGLLDVEETCLLPALEENVSWHVLEDLGEKVRAGRE
jgi:hypothetical protein